MSDEIQNCNVIRLVREESGWRALLGPEDRGLSVLSSTPLGALAAIAGAVKENGWAWDETWKPGKTDLHEV